MSPRAQRIAQAALSGIGLSAAVLMLWRTDFHALRTFGPWAALAVGIESLRILFEALATRSLYGDAVKVPWWGLLRAHAAGYALAMTTPAGRSVAEASKAVLLSRWVERGRSVGVAVTNQSLVMAATGFVAMACAAAADALGSRALTSATAAQGAVLLLAGFGLLATARSRPFGAWVARRIPRLAAVAIEAGDGARTPGVPAAFACFTAHRCVQLAQVFVLLGALGRWSPLTALALTGALIVGTSVGVAIPGQLGAVGGALALAGPGLGIPAPQCLALALVIHAAQFTWAAAGLAVWSTTKP